MIRTTLITLFAVVFSASAQGPEPGRGRGFGPPPGGPGARFLGAEAGMPGRVVKNAPFSADIVTESTQALPDGNHIRQTSTVKVYRDGEGRTRREQSPNMNGLTKNADMPALVFIHDPVGGITLTLNSTDKPELVQRTWARAAAVVVPVAVDQSREPSRGDQAAARPRRNPANDPNLKTESLGTRNFDGVLAEGRRTTMTIPAGQMGNDLPIQIVTETWTSSELQTVLYQKRSDPRNGETVTRFTNISRAEPSRTLFDAPSDFKVTESNRPRPRIGGPGPGQIR